MGDVIAVGLITTLFIFFMSNMLGKILIHEYVFFVKKYFSTIVVGLLFYLVICLGLFFIIHFFTSSLFLYSIFLIATNIVLIFWAIYYFCIKLRISWFNGIIRYFQGFLKREFLIGSGSIILLYLIYVVFYKISSLEFNYIKETNAIFSFLFPSVYHIFLRQSTTINNYSNAYVLPFFWITIIYLLISYINYYLIKKTVLVYNFGLTFVYLALFLLIFKTGYYNVYIILITGIFLYLSIYYNSFQRELKTIFSSAIFLISYFLDPGLLFLWIILAFTFFSLNLVNKNRSPLANVILFVITLIIPLFYELINNLGNFSTVGIIFWILIVLSILASLYLIFYNSLILRIIDVFFAKINYWLIGGLFLGLIVLSYLLTNSWSFSDLNDYYHNNLFLPLAIKKTKNFYYSINLICLLLPMIVGFIGIGYEIFNSKDKDLLKITIFSKYFFLLIIFGLNPIAINLWRNIYINFNSANQNASDITSTLYASSLLTALLVFSGFCYHKIILKQTTIKYKLMKKESTNLSSDKKKA